MEYPKLRFVDAFPVETDNGQMIGLRDPNGISPEMMVLSPDVFYLLQFFDGAHSHVQIQEEYLRTFGRLIQKDQLNRILANLDANLFLESQKYVDKFKAVEKDFLEMPIRPAVHAGQSYEAEPAKLRAQIDSFFKAPNGAGLPDNTQNNTEIKGLVAPHIDVKAGGSCYSFAYKALAESKGADCFIILGTGHSGLVDLYSTIDKDFDTPFGVAKCDSEFIKSLKRNYPLIASSEVLPHKAEHVIEFQLVFLKYLYENFKDFTFVPILCSFSYHLVTDPRFARHKQIVEDFTGALKKTIAESGKKICVIASVDFSHVGLRYGDEKAPNAAFMDRVKTFDLDMVKAIENLNSRAFCKTVTAIEDRYRVCGFSSIYTILKSINARQGKLLDYANTEVDTEKSTVTFASMVLY